jgi:heptosyltransferase-2
LELAQSLVEQGYTIHLHGSNEDATICSLIEQTLEPALVINFAGKLSLVEVAKEISSASVAITNDSGLMHVASAVGTPVISIFGPTVREFGFMPRADNAIVLENVGLYCRPCTAIGREDCPEGHFRCMREITAEKVLAVININHT